jgi:putative ABC transport system permease protein
MSSEPVRIGGVLTLIKIACRNTGRNLRRTVLCILAVAIAVFFTIIMQAMIAGMTDNINEVVQVFDTGHISIASTRYEAEKEYMPVQYPVAEGENMAELERRIEAVPGVRKVLPRINAFATLQDSTVKHAMLWGINIPEELALHPFNLTKRNSGLVEGRYPGQDSNECAIGVQTARKTGLRVGDRLPLKTISAQFSDKMWAPVITGIYQFEYLKYDDGTVLVDYSRLQRLLVLGERAQQLFIFVDNENQSRAVAGEVRALLGEEDLVRDWQDNYIVVLMRQSMMIFAAVYLVFLVVASFLIINTLVMIIHERIREIGMMGSLGMTRTEIVKVFFCEAVLLSVLGALAGAVIGGLTCFIFSFFPLDYNAMTGGGFREMPMSGTLTLAFDPLILLQGFVLGVVVASVCTFIPSLKSAFVEPVEALRR